MGDKESEKRLTKLEKQGKELDARMDKLEKLAKKMKAAPKKMAAKEAEAAEMAFPSGAGDDAEMNVQSAPETPSDF